MNIKWFAIEKVFEMTSGPNFIELLTMMGFKVGWSSRKETGDQFNGYAGPVNTALTHR